MNIKYIQLILSIIMCSIYAPWNTKYSMAGDTHANHIQMDIAAKSRQAWQLIEKDEPDCWDKTFTFRSYIITLKKQNRTSWLGLANYLVALSSLHSHKLDQFKIWLRTATATSIEPEAVMSLMAITPDRTHDRTEYIKCLAKLLPVSTWQSELDAKKTRITALVNPSRSIVPLLEASPDRLAEIASLFGQAHLYNYSWRSFAEVVYVGFFPTLENGKIDGTWLSPEAAEYWYKTAKSARLAGKQDLAWDYLMKAAVFGSDDLYKKAQATAKQWNENPKPVMPKTVDPKIKRQALVKIVHLYMDMNADPRAWELIDSHRKDFDHPDELRKQVEAHWRTVVKNVSRAATKVTLYGHEVYPHGDPMKVTIPWALSEKAIASVKERLQKMHGSGPQTQTTNAGR